MGNSYSIVQQLSREEQEERDYARLVEAVEAAQNAQLQFGQSPDVPAPYGLQGSHPQTSTPGSWPAPTPYQPRQNVRYSTGFVPPSSTLGLLDQTRIPVATSQRPPAQERKSDGSHTMVESPADGRAYAHPDEIEPVCEEACAMPASYTPSSSNVSRGRSLTRHRPSSRPPSRSPDRPVMLRIAPDPPKYPEDSPACVKRTLRSTRRILPRKVPGGCIASPQYRRASSPDSPASRHESMRRSPSIARGCDHCTPSLFARRDTAPECPPEAIPTSRPPSASVVSYRSRSSRVTSLGPRARRSSRSPPQAVIMSVVLRAGTPPRCRDPSPLSRESRRHASRSPSPSTPCLSPQSPLPSEAPSSPPLVATRLPSLSPPPTSRERSMRTEDSVRRRPSETAISVERPPSRRSRSSSPHIDFHRQMRNLRLVDVPVGRFERPIPDMPSRISSPGSIHSLRRSSPVVILPPPASDDRDHSIEHRESPRLAPAAGPSGDVAPLTHRGSQSLSTRLVHPNRHGVLQNFFQGLLSRNHTDADVPLSSASGPVSASSGWADLRPPTRAGARGSGRACLVMEGPRPDIPPPPQALCVQVVAPGSVPVGRPQALRIVDPPLLQPAFVEPAHAPQVVGASQYAHVHRVPTLRPSSPKGSVKSLISGAHSTNLAATFTGRQGSGLYEKVRSPSPPGACIPPNVPFQPYVNLVHAVGLPHQLKSKAEDGWRPAWRVFPLKVFRGSDYKIMKIEAAWDDEALLSELRRTYDDLRTVWRKWFSLRNVASMTMVHADHSIIYPQRVGPAKVSPSKNMRLRWFLHHPSYMRGRHEFMQVLTARTDLGIEFVERWQLSRIAIAVLLPVLASVVIGVVYSIAASDPSTAFTIAGYLTSAYSVCLVLVGLLNFVES